MAKTAQIPANILENVKKAMAKVGALPLSARKGQVIAITVEKIQQLAANNNEGAIKGLGNIGGGQLFDSYTCTMESTDRDAQEITYQKDGQNKTMKVPSWQVTEGAELIELVASPVTAPLNVPVPTA